jgi:tetratricopeptide (TPR) repeat protein
VIADGRALLTGICLCAIVPGAFADVPEEALVAVDEGSWRKAIILLKSNTDDPEARRMLGISYFQASDYDHAFPLVESALEQTPDDPELNSAMLDLRLARQEWNEAKSLTEKLAEHGDPDSLKFASMQIELGSDQGDRSLAKSGLLELLESPETNTEIALDAADLLIKTLLQDQERHEAYRVARLAISRDPDSPESIRYSQFIHETQGSGKVHFDLGYRLEYDDNICLADDSRASGKEDFRQVLMVDVLYEKPLKEGWSVYAQGNLFQAFHNEFDNFNYSRIKGSAGVGKSGNRSGWRFPVEAIQDRLDGNIFRTSLAVLPAYYVQFSKDFFSHFYARIQSDDYEFIAISGFNANSEEDRSGDVNGLGVLLAGQLSAELSLRSYLEFNRYDTNGSLWKRDEMVAFAYGEYVFKDNWTAGVALRYQDEDFDNPRSSEFAQQSESKELYLNLTRKFRNEWTWRGQVSFINHESNVPIFDYERNVYSFSVSREF